VCSALIAALNNSRCSHREEPRANFNNIDGVPQYYSCAARTVVGSVMQLAGFARGEQARICLAKLAGVAILGLRALL
jgi:hypothetical protein